jgi:hypothetical protein
VTAGVFLAGALRAPWVGLTAILGIIAGFLVLRNPGFGIGLLTVLIPLERMQRITNDDATFTISLMRIVALVCLVAIALARIHQRRSMRLDPAILLYGIYAFLAVIGLLFSTDPYGTKRVVGTILSNCLFFILYLNYFQRRAQVHFTIALWLAASLGGAIYSAYDWHLGSGSSGAQKLVDPGQGTQTTGSRWSTVWEDITEFEAQGGSAVRRSMGPTSHASVYGINLIMTIPFYFYLIRRHRRLWQQAGLFLAFGLILYNILLTNTRATFLVAAITGGLCMFYGLFRIRKAHVFAGLCALALLIPIVPKDALERMLDPHKYSVGQDGTLSIRLRYWDAGLRILSEHFLLGVGVGNEKEVPAQIEEKDVGQQSVHNIYLQVALETGILGWLAFFSFVGLSFYYVQTSARRLRALPDWDDEYHLALAMKVAMLAVLIYGLQVDVFNFPVKGWWLIAAIAPVLYQWTRGAPAPVQAFAPARPAALYPAPAR